MKRFFVFAFLFALFCSANLHAEQTEEFTAKTDNDGIQRVQITATEYSFSPKHIIVRANVPTEFIVRKEKGLVPHNITLKAPEAGIDFSESLSTDPITIKFTPTKPGTYFFFCNKKMIFSKSHREKGMEGILEVRE